QRAGGARRHVVAPTGGLGRDCSVRLLAGDLVDHDVAAAVLLFFELAVLADQPGLLFGRARELAVVKLPIAGVVEIGDLRVALDAGALLPAAVHALAGRLDDHLAVAAQQQRGAVLGARGVAFVLGRARVACGRDGEVTLGALGIGDAAELPGAVLELHPVVVLALDHRLLVGGALRLALGEAGLADGVLGVGAAG